MSANLFCSLARARPGTGELVNIKFNVPDMTRGPKGAYLATAAARK